MLETDKRISWLLEITLKRQHGFRESRSCMTKLLDFSVRVSKILEKRDGWMDSVSLDCQEAFDNIVPHSRMIKKQDIQVGVRTE